MRFGWDPIIGLIPGLGDISTGLFSLFLLITAVRLRVPRVIRVRMILNTLIDVAAGVVPLAGDVLDFAWKSNSRNLALLERYGGSQAEPGASDWIFVLGILVSAASIVLIPLMVLAWIFQALETKFLGTPLFNNVHLF
jgi:hypothetical protein